MVYFDNFGIMKKIGNKTAWLATFLLTLASLFTACSSDDVAEQGGGRPEAGLTLRIAANATTSATRARTTEWEDTNDAQDEEMMNLWVVVVTNTSDGAVQKCFACRPSAGAEREIDEVGQLPQGAYTVYSFANISVTNVCSLLGITAPGLIPQIAATPTEIGVTGTVNYANVTAKVATVNGNGFNPNAADNGYGEKGIPMSNVQTVAATESQKDLIVVRMLAKIKLSVKNETGAAVTIKYATISNITGNVANNLKLLPNWTSTGGKDVMDVTQHGDLQPNLNGTPATVEMTVPDMASATAIENNGTREVTFYINECKKPTDFYLTIGLGDETNTKEYRYALIDDEENTDEDHGKWDYIARNDYRVIPIVLDDYHFELIPYDFPAIGVYPCSVREIDTENHIFEFTFHDYGHFHLLPKVTKGTSTQVKYNVGTGDYWTLDTDFAGSWNTAATKGGTWLDDTGITSNGFYRNETATADADEAGGVPVWYANTSSPQWDPAGGSDYQPFIFGYIADPGKALAADKKIYHEMKIKLYVGGAYRRDMIYRFYMTLSKDQMSYSRGDVTPGGSRGLGVERPRLPHNHIWK